jgi:hypothetical protein
LELINGREIDSSDVEITGAAAANDAVALTRARELSHMTKGPYVRYFEVHVMSTQVRGMDDILIQELD